MKFGSGTQDPGTAYNLQHTGKDVETQRGSDVSASAVGSESREWPTAGNITKQDDHRSTSHERESVSLPDHQNLDTGNAHTQQGIQLHSLETANVPSTSDQTTRQGINPEAMGRETCPICIVDFEEGDDLRLLPCEGKHRFHQECVDPWLLELSSSCPICRQGKPFRLGY